MQQDRRTATLAALFEHCAAAGYDGIEIGPSMTEFIPWFPQGTPHAERCCLPALCLPTVCFCCFCCCCCCTHSSPLGEKVPAVPAVAAGSCCLPCLRSACVLQLHAESCPPIADCRVPCSPAAAAAAATAGSGQSGRWRLGPASLWSGAPTASAAGPGSKTLVCSDSL